MKKYDVIALGELLIDFTENGKSSQGNPMYEANPGGAPCNVLAMLNRFGHKTAFIGKIGNDFFGDQLQDAMKEVGIDTIALARDEEVHTTLAMVHKTENGDREFSFYRNPGADMMLAREDIPVEMLEDCKVFHFGTLSMTHDGNRCATEYAVKRAKQSHALISFDPNLRMALWKDEERLRERVLFGLSVCDVLKISDNEIQWLTSLEDYSDGVRWIRERFDIPLIFVSMGREGSRAYWKDLMVEEKAYLRKDTIETTGAGDTFMGCMLHSVLENGIERLEQKKLQEMLSFANCAAAIVTTRKGALRVMPTVEEVWEAMKL